MGGGVAWVYKKGHVIGLRLFLLAITWPELVWTCCKLATFLARTSKGITLGQNNSTKLQTCYYHHHQLAFSKLETTWKKGSWNWIWNLLLKKRLKSRKGLEVTLDNASHLIMWWDAWHFFHIIKIRYGTIFMNVIFFSSILCFNPHFHFVLHFFVTKFIYKC